MSVYKNIDEGKTMEQFELDLNTAIYNQFSEKYCRERLSGNVLFNDYIEAPVVRNLLGESNKLQNKSVLDIGCGPGIYTKMLLMAGANVVALDSSEFMLNATREYCTPEGSELAQKVEFLRARFEDIDLEKRKFDIVLATFMLSYFENLSEAFRKMALHLNKGGKIIASILHPIRMFSVRTPPDSYLLSNYYSGGYYSADFLDKSKPLRLKRYTLEEIYLAAEDGGLQVKNIYEPKANIGCGFADIEKVKFYSNNPSILVVSLTVK